MRHARELFTLGLDAKPALSSSRDACFARSLCLCLFSVVSAQKRLLHASALASGLVWVETRLVDPERLLEGGDEHGEQRATPSQMQSLPAPQPTLASDIRLQKTDNRHSDLAHSQRNGAADIAQRVQPSVSAIAHSDSSECKAHNAHLEAETHVQASDSLLRVNILSHVQEARDPAHAQPDLADAHLRSAPDIFLRVCRNARWDVTENGCRTGGSAKIIFCCDERTTSPDRRP